MSQHARPYVTVRDDVIGAMMQQRDNDGAIMQALIEQPELLPGVLTGTRPNGERDDRVHPKTMMRVVHEIIGVASCTPDDGIVSAVGAWMGRETELMEACNQRMERLMSVRPGMEERCHIIQCGTNPLVALGRLSSRAAYDAYVGHHMDRVQRFPDPGGAIRLTAASMPMSASLMRLGRDEEAITCCEHGDTKPLEAKVGAAFASLVTKRFLGASQEGPWARRHLTNTSQACVEPGSACVLAAAAMWWPGDGWDNEAISCYPMLLADAPRVDATSQQQLISIAMTAIMRQESGMSGIAAAIDADGIAAAQQLLARMSDGTSAKHP